MNLKLPHWLQIALAGVGVVLSWLAQQQQLGVVVLPAWAASLVTILLLVLAGLGITSGSALPSKSVPSPPPLPCLLMALLAVFLAACTKEQTSAVVTVSLDAGICILNHSSDPPATIAKECGVAAVEDVIRFLDAQHAAMVRASAAPCTDGGAP